MSETTPDPADAHTGTDRKGCTCGEGDAVGDTTPGTCFVDASGVTVHRPPDLTDEEHRRRLWRDLADKDIQHGVDWPGVVRVLFADIDALTAEVEFSTGTDRVELTDAEKWLIPHLTQLDAAADARDVYAAVGSIVAARLQALTAERDELRKSLDYWVELWKKAANGVIGLQADLSEARAEADELRSSLEASHAEIAGLHSAWSERDSELAAANTRTTRAEAACVVAANQRDDALREVDDERQQLQTWREAFLKAESQRDALAARCAELEAKWLASDQRAERNGAAADALQATLDRVVALADEWDENGINCECGHSIGGEHNGIGCYARLSYNPLVTCECKLTDDQFESDIAVRDLRAALTPEGNR